MTQRREGFAGARGRVALSVAVIIALLLAVAGLCLEAGAWQRTERISGPFSPEGVGPTTYLVPTGIKGRVGRLLNAVSDDVGTSDLRLWVNGEEWGPAHAAHVAIRLGNTRAFSHWNGNIHLSLPPELANGPSTELRVVYPVRLRSAILWALIVAAAGLLLLHQRLFKPDRLRLWAPRLQLVFSYLAIVGVAVYACTIPYALYLGYALPTAAVFDLIPGATRLAAIEPYLPIAILIFAAFGATTTWLGGFAILPRSAMRRAEIAQLRLWAKWGLPAIVALLVFSVGNSGWSGHVRQTDVNFSYAGLVPYSDAANYFTAISDQIQFGTWNVIASRRPLAGGFRELIGFAVHYSYAGMLLAQTVLVALMLFLAAWRIALWRGIWASIAFVGLVYLLAQPYLATTMSEPPGMAWGLFCATFFIEALRRQSTSHALVALFALTMGLWTRMGAMLAVPMVMLWIVGAFGENMMRRLRLLLVAAGTVVAVLAINSVLAYLYGEANTVTGSNFSYVLCGLSLGGDWGTCPNSYGADLARLDEKSQAAFLVEKAWGNFSHDPRIAFAALLRNACDFASSAPRFLLGGGKAPDRATALNVVLATLALLPGLAYVLRSRSSRTEHMFWLALGIGIVLSAAVVFADAGWRNMHVTNVLLALFVALGFTAPGNVVMPSRDHWLVQPRTGVAIIAAASALFVIVPALARVLDRIELPSHAASPQPNVHLVAGGRWATGFLVVADGAGGPGAAPSMSFPEFEKLVRQFDMETEMGPFLSEAATRVPFAFMTTPDVNQRNTTAIYIAPPEVLVRRDVAIWRLHVPRVHPDNILRVVERAEPVASR